MNLTGEPGIVLVRTDRHGRAVHWLKINWKETARRAACGGRKAEDTEGGGVIAVATVGLVLACKKCDDLLHGRSRPRCKKKERGLFGSPETEGV